MIVDREVDQVFIAGLHHLAGDELRTQHAIAAFALHVVATILREVQLPGKESDIVFGFREAGEDDGTMLISVAGEEMSMEPGVHPLRHEDSPRLVQVRLLSHRRTFCSLRSAVSVAGFSRLERRDS